MLVWWNEKQLVLPQLFQHQPYVVMMFGLVLGVHQDITDVDQEEMVKVLVE